MELLQKVNAHGFFDKNPGIAHSDDASNHIPMFSKLADEPLRAVPEDGISYDGYSSAGLGRQLADPSMMAIRQNRSQTLSTFSPFSPDPNLFAAVDKPRRESVPFGRQELLTHPAKCYSPGFAPSLHDPKVVGSSNGKISPPSGGRPNSGSHGRYGTFLDGSAAPFQMGRVDGPISRPSSGQTATSASVSSGRGAGGAGAGGYESGEHEMIQDLNGTLASLDLDQTHEPWKSPSRSSDGSVGGGQQPTFKMVGAGGQTRTPTP
jgi:hypothetical protein